METLFISTNMSPQANSMLLNEVVPRLYSAVPRAVQCIGSEDPDELIQDGTAMAAKMIKNAEKNKKKVTAGNIAYYTIQHLKSGRRSVGSSTADVLGTGTQINGRSSVGSLEEEIAIENEFDCPLTMADIVSIDTDDPAQKAMRKLDWELFLQSTDDRAKMLIVWLGEGKSLGELAKKWKTSVDAVRRKKNELLRKLQEFFGEDMWEVVAALPHWKDDLRAMREWMACRYERQWSFQV